ncbi:MAG: hypothetical protein ACI37O_01905 [Candidatus Avelusimicrobium sp.]|uniref:hypothetical protein n=1 Tax=Candidatus Avelusimicrobium sp. TaxID=3048833 RepID=UPI003F0B2E84
MKKLLTLCLGFIPCAALAATNKISMVTYFPVPYVAYSQLNATEQMDIGLTNSCDMTLGCSETSATLNAARVNLTGGQLNLDGGRGIKGNTLSLGNGSGAGKISFQNVRIHTGTMESMNAGDIKAATLNLFGKAFPSCKSANSESGGQMQWTSLKLKGASSNELYLACGGVASSSEPKADCSDKTYKLANKSECCPSMPTTDTDCWTTEWEGRGSSAGQETEESGPSYFCDLSVPCIIGDTCTTHIHADYVSEEEHYECVGTKNGW